MPDLQKLILIQPQEFYPYSSSRSPKIIGGCTAEIGPRRRNRRLVKGRFRFGLSALRPAAGTVGNLLPCLFVYLVDIFGQRVSFAAIHAAEAHRASTEEQEDLSLAFFTFQSCFHMSPIHAILADLIPFWKMHPVCETDLL